MTVNQPIRGNDKSERCGKATVESFKRGKCCSENESLVGNWKAVGVLESTSDDHDQVDNSPNSTSTKSDELENSSSSLAGVEVVHTQCPEENSEEQ